MNTVLQQLYMQPGIRGAIMGVEREEEDLGYIVLYIVCINYRVSLFTCMYVFMLMVHVYCFILVKFVLVSPDICLFAFVHHSYLHVHVCSCLCIIVSIDVIQSRYICKASIQPQCTCR